MPFRKWLQRRTRSVTSACPGNADKLAGRPRQEGASLGSRYTCRIPGRRGLPTAAIRALTPTAGTKPQPPLQVPSRLWRDSAVIDIAPVIDVEDVDFFAVFVHRVANPVLSAPCTPMPVERGSQRCADPVRFLGQRAEDELITGPRGSRSCSCLAAAGEITAW